MDFSAIVSFIRDRVSEIGFELYDIQIKDSGRQLIIRVFIDKKEGFVGIQDCVRVSRLLEPYLESVVQRRFVIEVSSPGADRDLKDDRDFERFKGMTVEVIKKGGTRIVGKLMGKIGDEVFIMPLKRKDKEKKKEQGKIKFRMRWKERRGKLTKEMIWGEIKEGEWGKDEQRGDERRGITVEDSGRRGDKGESAGEIVAFHISDIDRVKLCPLL